VDFLKLTCLATSSGPAKPDSSPNPNPGDLQSRFDKVNRQGRQERQEKTLRKCPLPAFPWRSWRPWRLKTRLCIPPNPNSKDERYRVPQPPKDRNAKLASCTGYSTKSHDTIDRRLYASKLHCIMQETTAIYRRTASPFFKPRTEK